MLRGPRKHVTCGNGELVGTVYGEGGQRYVVGVSVVCLCGGALIPYARMLFGGINAGRQQV